MHFQEAAPVPTLFQNDISYIPQMENSEPLEQHPIIKTFQVLILSKILLPCVGSEKVFLGILAYNFRFSLFSNTNDLFEYHNGLRVRKWL